MFEENIYDDDDNYIDDMTAQWSSIGVGLWSHLLIYEPHPMSLKQTAEITIAFSCKIRLIELILHCDAATEECVSNAFFRHSLDDSPAFYLT